jgi:hypothetical protein
VQKVAEETRLVGVRPGKINPFIFLVKDDIENADLVRTGGLFSSEKSELQPKKKRIRKGPRTDWVPNEQTTIRVTDYDAAKAASRTAAALI